MSSYEPSYDPSVSFDYRDRLVLAAVAMYDRPPPKAKQPCCSHEATATAAASAVSTAANAVSTAANAVSTAANAVTIVARRTAPTPKQARALKHKKEEIDRILSMDYENAITKFERMRQRCRSVYKRAITAAKKLRGTFPLEANVRIHAAREAYVKKVRTLNRIREDSLESANRRAIAARAALEH